MLIEIGLLSLSLLPGLIIIIFIFFSDKHEKEPIGLLAISFFFGILTFGLSYYAGDFLIEHYQVVLDYQLQDLLEKRRLF